MVFYDILKSRSLEITVLVGITFAVLVSRCDGLPITGCPKYKGNFYIADHINKCVYYWCNDGRLIAGGKRCPLGTGVPGFHRSDRNPCQLQVRSCSRFGDNRGGMDRSTLPPTTRRYTQTPHPEVTTEVDTTPVTTQDLTTEEQTTMEVTTIDTTTQQDDVTTQEVTEETGSGDIDDFMEVTEAPGGGSGGASYAVHSDMHISGGLQLANVPTLADCLITCSLLGSVCVGLDFDTGTCSIHTAASGCSPLEPLDGSVHIRFVNC